MSDMDIAALNQAAIDQSDAEDPAVFQAVLGIMLSGRRQTAKVHAALIQQAEFDDVTLDAVKKIVGSGAFLLALSEAQNDPDAFLPKRIKRNAFKALAVEEGLMAQTEDKRVQHSAAQTMLGMAGYSPTNKVEMGEDTAAFLARMLSKPPTPETETAP
jgi:hypothetical protein